VNNTIRQLLDQIKHWKTNCALRCTNRSRGFPIRSMASALSRTGDPGCAFPLKVGIVRWIIAIDPKTCFARRLSTA